MHIRRCTSATTLISGKSREINKKLSGSGGLLATNSTAVVRRKIRRQDSEPLWRRTPADAGQTCESTEASSDGAACNVGASAPRGFAVDVDRLTENLHDCQGRAGCRR